MISAGILTTAFPVAVSLAAAFGFGFSTRRGGLCMIAALDDALEKRRFGRILTFAFIVGWVVVINGLGRAVGAKPAPQIFSTPYFAVLGGCIFGIGAALNGACSFGTLGRLAGGDLSFLATIGGIAGGFALERVTVRADLPNALSAPFAVEAWVALAAAAFLVAHLAFARRPSGPDCRYPGRWLPSKTAAAIGITGGILYILHKKWSYSLVIGSLVDGSASVLVSDHAVVAMVLVAIAAGAVVGAFVEQSFSPRLRLQLWIRRLFGGLVMGGAAALIPGGNDVLVLHGMPELSAQAFWAFAGMLASAIAILAVVRRLGALGAWFRLGL